MPAYGVAGPVGPMGGGTGRTLGMQRFLVSQGYQLSPDGVLGPKTSAALADWRSGIHNRNPQRWNQKYASNPAVSTRPSPAGGAPSAPRKTAGVGGSKTSPNPLADLPDFQFINPASYAKNAVAAEYNPQIAELVRQQMAAKNQMAPNLANIQGWYDNALKDLDAQAVGENGLFDRIGTKNEAMAKNLMAAGGGDMAAAMATLGDNQMDQIQAADKQFNTAEHGRFALAGAEASKGEMNRLNAMQSDLAAALLQAKGAKGAAYKTALGDAYNTRNQQLVAAQNYEAQKAMLPLQLEGQRQTMDANRQQAEDEHKSNLQQIMMNKLQLRLGRQAANGSGAGATVPDFSNIDPGKRQALRSELIQSAIKSGANPMQVFNMLGNSMRAYSGGKWNPHSGGQPGMFRDALMQEYVNYWNSTHPHAGQYVWSFPGGGKAPVRGKLRPKPKS